jgi:hypothetical protein
MLQEEEAKAVTPAPLASTMAANEEKRPSVPPTYNVVSELNVMDVLKRYHPVAYFSEASDLAFSLASVFYRLVGDQFPPSLIQYYAKMYRGFIGNLRFKVITSGTPSSYYSASFSATPVVQKRVLYRATATTMEPGPVAVQKGILEVQTPFNTMFHSMVMPFNLSETFNYQSNFGYVVFSGLSDTGVIYACLADGARFFNLCNIPRLQLVANNYPHDGSPAVDVPQYGVLNHDSASTQYDFSQEILDSWNIIAESVSPTVPAQITTFQFELQYASDEVLRTIFGITIQENQPRNILTGVTSTQTVDLTDIWSVYPNVGLIFGPTDAFPSLSMPFSYADSPISFTNEFGQLEIATDSVAVDDYTNTSVRQTLSIPMNVFVVANATSGTTATVRTGPSLPPFGPVSLNRRQVSINPLWSLTEGDFVAVDAAVHAEVKAPEQRRIVVAQGDMGFVMPDQKVQVSAGSLPNDARMITIGEESPDLTKLTERKQFLDTTFWSADQTAGTIIASYSVPFDLINSKAMAPAWAGSIFWRGTPCVTLQLQSTQFACGCLIVVWCPLMDSALAAQTYGGRLASANLARYMKMYPTTNPTIEFEIPFFYPASHLDVRQTSMTLGTLIVMVHNPLSLGDSAPTNSVAMTAYGSFKNSEFAVLNPKTVAQGGIQSKVTNYNIQHVVDSAIDVSSTSEDSFAGGATDLKTNARMDKPNLGLTPMPMIARLVPNLANNVDIEYAQNLDLPAASVPPVPVPVTGLAEDEMSLVRMFRMPGYINTFSVLAANIPNDVLFTGDLCPGSEFFTLGAGGVVDLSLLSYATLPFSYWSGSIVVDLEVIATAFHICKLAICSHYGYEASGLTVEESMGQYTTIFDVRGYSTIRVTFPWRSATPWKLVCNGSYADASPFLMGQFSVRLLSPLQYNETIASNISVNVYMSGGSDFKTAFVGCNAIDVAPVDLS